MYRDGVEMLVGFTLLLSAFMMSFMMVVGVLERDILLSLLAYSMSLAGIILGLHGILGYVGGKQSSQ